MAVSLICQKLLKALLSLRKVQYTGECNGTTLPNQSLSQLLENLL
jgi:hypothetical protein